MSKNTSSEIKIIPPAGAARFPDSFWQDFRKGVTMFQRSLKTSLLIATMMVVLNCFAWAEEAAKPAAAAPAEAAAPPEAAKPAEPPATLSAPRAYDTYAIITRPAASTATTG